MGRGRIIMKMLRVRPPACGHRVASVGLPGQSEARYLRAAASRSTVTQAAAAAAACSGANGPAQAAANCIGCGRDSESRPGQAYTSDSLQVEVTVTRMKCSPVFGSVGPCRAINCLLKLCPGRRASRPPPPARDPCEPGRPGQYKCCRHCAGGTMALPGASESRLPVAVRAGRVAIGSARRTADSPRESRASESR